MRQSSMFEGLVRRLRLHGVSRAYAERYAEELRDHWEDLVEECERNGLDSTESASRAMERLGALETLTGAAVSSFRRSTFIGRHPFLFFALLPAVLGPIVIALIFVLLLLPLLPLGIGSARGLLPAWRWLPEAICVVCNHVVPGTLAVFAYGAGQRRALENRFRVASGAILIAWGSFLHCSTYFRDEIQRQAIMFGASPRPITSQVLTAVVLVLVYWRFVQMPRGKTLRVAG